MAISDHAVLRYLERVKGINIAAVRDAVLPKHVTKVRIGKPA